MSYRELNDQHSVGLWFVLSQTQPTRQSNEQFSLIPGGMWDLHPDSSFLCMLLSFGAMWFLLEHDSILIAYNEKGILKQTNWWFMLKTNVKNHPLYPTGQMIENGFRSLFWTSKACALQCLNPAGKYCSFESIVRACPGETKLTFMITGLSDPLSVPWTGNQGLGQAIAMI